MPAEAACAAPTSSRLTSSLTEAERLLLPRAESSSDPATHAPRASFQIERYVRFMSCYLQISTQHTRRFRKTNMRCGRANLKIDGRSLLEVDYVD
ncbi:hypothetical protein BDSB_22715 [Burkholderia dolosa PC543]|nr:hypothetical protein BDSB_22715 [Burkholderia dolosa PC543]